MLQSQTYHDARTVSKDGFRDLEKGTASKEELLQSTNKEIARSEGRMRELEANMSPVELHTARSMFDAKHTRALAEKQKKMGSAAVGGGYGMMMGV